MTGAPQGTPPRGDYLTLVNKRRGLGFLAAKSAWDSDFGANFAVQTNVFRFIDNEAGVPRHV